MRLLLVARHYAVASGRYLADAFARCGVDVRTIGPAIEDNAIYGGGVPPDLIWHAAGDEQSYWPDWRPDLVLLCDSLKYHHRHYHEVPHLAYGVDNHVFNYRQDGIAHYFLAHSRGRYMPVQGPDVTWLPAAYDPVWFTPSPIPYRQRQFDVAMIGVCYPPRMALIEAILAANIRVVYGAGPIFGQYRDHYHNARISLCLGALNDVGMRVFETAAMRCLVLSDPCPDLANLDADGLVVYDRFEVAVKAIQYLLAHPEEAETRIERSYAWAKPHTWDARARFMLDWFDKNYRAAFS